MVEKGFKAQIEAEDGHLLIGGVKQYTTASYEIMIEAQKAAAVIYKNNKAAGKRVKKGMKVFEVNYVDYTSEETDEA